MGRLTSKSAGDYGLVFCHNLPEGKLLDLTKKRETLRKQSSPRAGESYVSRTAHHRARITLEGC
jgi:hypothetical protein